MVFGILNPFRLCLAKNLGAAWYSRGTPFTDCGFKLTSSECRIHPWIRHSKACFQVCLIFWGGVFGLRLKTHRGWSVESNPGSDTLAVVAGFGPQCRISFFWRGGVCYYEEGLLCISEYQIRHSDLTWFWKMTSYIFCVEQIISILLSFGGVSDLG